MSEGVAHVLYGKPTAGAVPPRRNRVTPLREIEAAPVRCSLMGNRGILHADDGSLGRKRWQHRSWVTCTLDAPGPKRPLAAAGHYTVLFFHDEAVSLAAGHRPCAHCRRGAYNRFLAAWKMGHGIAAENIVTAKDLDVSLHRARISHDGQQTRVEMPLADVPDGAFVGLLGKPDMAWLVWQGALHRWVHGGYAERRSLTPITAEVLTPAPILHTLKAGYVPELTIPSYSGNK